MQNPSSPSRREFFKRAGAATAAVAVALTPVSLLAQKPNTDARIRVDGDNFSLHNAVIGNGGIEIHGNNIQIANCQIDMAAAKYGILVNNDA